MIYIFGRHIGECEASALGTKVEPLPRYMRRLLLISALVAIMGLPRLASAEPALAHAGGGKLSSIYLIGTLDRRDRPRVFARFDRTLPAARGALRGARVRLVVHGDVAVRGTGVSEPVYTVVTRRLGSLHRTGSWMVQLPLRLGQAGRIERAAVNPSQLTIDGTAIQTVLPRVGGPLPGSRIKGVTAASGAEFEAQEKVNGSVRAYYVVEETGCEHTKKGCPTVAAPGTWSNPTWDEYENGEDNVHGDLSMASCNGGWSGVCEGISGGLFAATEINVFSPYPEGTAYFNVSEGSNGITPNTEIAAHYNEHETSSPPTACHIAAYAYTPTFVPDGPEPTIFCSQTEIEGNEPEEEEAEEGDEGEGTAFDSYVVTTVWPVGSNPP